MGTSYFVPSKLPNLEEHISGRSLREGFEMIKASLRDVVALIGIGIVLGIGMTLYAVATDNVFVVYILLFLAAAGMLISLFEVEVVVEKEGPLNPPPPEEEKR